MDATEYPPDTKENPMGFPGAGAFGPDHPGSPFTIKRHVTAGAASLSLPLWKPRPINQEIINIQFSERK